MTEMLVKSDSEQLDKSWKVIRIIWSSLFGSLAIYLLVCKFMEDQLRPVGIDIPLETFKNILFGVSIVILFTAHYVRKAMLKIPDRGAASTFAPASSRQIQHPAAGKYLSAIIVAMALSESIGIMGVVLFFLAKDLPTLYQFIFLSAIAMFYFRPRKEELLQLADEMEKQGDRKQA